MERANQKWSLKDRKFIKERHIFRNAWWILQTLKTEVKPNKMMTMKSDDDNYNYEKIPIEESKTLSVYFGHCVKSV